MKVIVAGSRSFNDVPLLYQTLDRLLQKNVEIASAEIVSGRAKGADQLGEMYAAENNISLKLFPADWDTHGKKAGILRNTQMAEYADILIAFWDGKSRGTKHMILDMLAKGKPVHVELFSFGRRDNNKEQGSPVHGL
jgi:hypothetical protein